jgi:hypothetical protein
VLPGVDFETLFLGISEIFAKGKKYAKMTFDKLDK